MLEVGDVAGGRVRLVGCRMLVPVRRRSLHADGGGHVVEHRLGRAVRRSGGDGLHPGDLVVVGLHRRLPRRLSGREVVGGLRRQAFERGGDGGRHLANVLRRVPDVGVVAVVPSDDGAAVDDGGLGVERVDGLVRPRVVAEAVADHEAGALERRAVARGRLVVVGVGGRAGDDRGHGGAIAAQRRGDVTPLVHGHHDTHGVDGQSRRAAVPADPEPHAADSSRQLSPSADAQRRHGRE